MEEMPLTSQACRQNLEVKWRCPTTWAERRDSTMGMVTALLSDIEE
jgi:hypothetical protein